MKAKLPELSPGELKARLEALGLPAITQECLDKLHAHYRELASWSLRAPLIGPGTAELAVERHYGESLAALSWLEGVETLVDIGSGAGFPGFVLSAALPECQGFLVEPRLKKVKFLRCAAETAGLDITVLEDRVDRTLPQSLPERIDCLTLRALKLDLRSWSLLLNRFTPRTRVCLWVGEHLPLLPKELVLEETRPLAGSDRRKVALYRLAV